MPSKPRPRNLQCIISQRELATVLYALRQYQAGPPPSGEWSPTYAPGGPLNSEETNTLCERLAFSPYAPKITANTQPLTPSDILTIEQLSSFVSETVGKADGPHHQAIT